MKFLTDIGVPKEKMIVGAAFYGRIFDLDNIKNNGLYQPGKFSKGLAFSKFNLNSLEKAGFIYYWDEVARAPYMFSAAKKQLLTYDNERSVGLKTAYALNRGLGGIMFWQLGEDKTSGGLLDAIDNAKQKQQ